MNTEKPLAARWPLFGLLAIGTLIFAGVSQVSAYNSVSRLQTEPLILDVPALKQANGTSCGEAVIAMVYNFIHPEATIGEYEVIEYARANGYYTPDRFPYTSPANMVRIAEHYMDDVEFGNVRTSNQGFAVLLTHLRRGDPLIIDVLSNFSDPGSEAHFIVVTGVSVDPERGNAIVIHYNDPLTGTKNSADWLGDDGVWNAWLTNGDPGGAGWWLVISGE